MSTDETEEQSRKSKKDKAAEEVKRPRSAMVRADDQGLAQWLFDLTEGGEHVQFVDVVPIVSRAQGGIEGNAIHSEPRKTNRPFTAEQAAELANKLLHYAQLDCDRVAKRPRAYRARAYDAGKAEGAYRHFPLDLRPKMQALQVANPNRIDDVEEDDLVLDGKKLQFLQLQDARKAAQYQFGAAAAMSGETFLLLRAHNDSLMEQNAQLHRQVMDKDALINDLHRQLREAEDNKLDRDLARKDKELWIDIKRDGYKHGRSLLVRMLGSDDVPDPSAPNGANGHATKYAESKESQLVDTFMEDCEKEKIDEILFGTWTLDDDKVLQCKKEGILTPAQVAILFGVAQRTLPPQALDPLLPGSKQENEITMQQIGKAQPHVPDGIGASLFAVFDLRKKKVAARAEKTTDKTED